MDVDDREAAAGSRLRIRDLKPPRLPNTLDTPEQIETCERPTSLALPLLLLLLLLPPNTFPHQHCTFLPLDFFHFPLTPSLFPLSVSLTVNLSSASVESLTAQPQAPPIPPGSG